MELWTSVRVFDKITAKTKGFFNLRFRWTTLIFSVDKKVDFLWKGGRTALYRNVEKFINMQNFIINIKIESYPQNLSTRWISL